MTSIYSEDGLQRLGEIIRQARGKKSYRDFEEKLSISHGTIRSLELGRANPEPKTLIKLANSLGYKYEELQALVSGRTPVPIRKVYAAEDLKPLIRELPVSEVVRLGQWIYEYLVGYDDNYDNRGDGKG